MAVRVVLTVGAELGVAWLFHLRSRGQMALILVVNLLTQGALNLGLNWYAYKNGTMFLFLPYLLMELGVVLAEGGAYLGLMPGGKGRGKQLGRLCAGCQRPVAGLGLGAGPVRPRNILMKRKAVRLLADSLPLQTEQTAIY